MLVGNKKDLDADRDVTYMEAARFAQENGEDYCPSSSLLAHGRAKIVKDRVKGDF